MNLQQNIMIFSVFQNNVDKSTNETNHARALRSLELCDIPAIELIGCYKKQIEKSILVCDFENRKLVEGFCEAYNQESHLESHNDRQTFLVFKNGAVQHIGKLINVSKEDALKCDAWTFNPVTKLYFVAR